MPYQNIHGAQIYYETFGTPQPGAVPVLLIHGSTQTGRSCWYNTVTRLESNHYIILPDCRGHGKSTNPHNTYTFREHAADMAALLQALGFESAHVVGHSNGGNIALLMLMEHPALTQTCVIQAGNAWVSPDLPIKEPPIFNPDFIEKERPAWLREMQELHAPTHGADYWRTLIQITLQELISEPNYTAQDLQAVTRPVFLIQGGEDAVNAPSQHAEFMARHIPASELWVPQGIGHNVHEDMLDEWLKRVTDFWARRATPAGDALHRYKLQHHPDERDGIFDLRLDSQNNLTGSVLTAPMREEALQLFPGAGDQIHVQLHTQTPWALVNRPVDDLRRRPGILSERVSQVRLGEAVRVLETAGDWSKVRVEHDSYLGWVHTRALHILEPEAVEDYLAASQSLVIARLAEARDESGALVQRIPFGVRLPIQKTEQDRAWVELPDGRLWQVALSDLSSPLSPNPEGIAQALRLMQRFAGVPYLWGGRTPYGYDCSGFAGTFYASMGITLPRDADQQFACGTPVQGDLQPGDLLFFGELPAEEDIPGPDARGYARHAHISHVGISLGGAEFIHANGADWGVSTNSLNPQSPRYGKWLHENYRGARRYW
jgi:pimeloyl-ACP methyl ester carboxylesterase